METKGASGISEEKRLRSQKEVAKANVAYGLPIEGEKTKTGMAHDRINVAQEIGKVADFLEGITSLMAGSYVLSLAVTKSNIVLRVALGMAGGYLILRSGAKLRAARIKKSGL